MRKLEKLRESQSALESEAEARRRTKEEAEALGQEAKEKHRSAWNELQAAKRKEQESQHVAKLFVELDSDHSGVISSPEVQARSELDGDTDGTVTETEARCAEHLDWIVPLREKPHSKHKQTHDKLHLLEKSVLHAGNKNVHYEYHMRDTEIEEGIYEKGVYVDSEMSLSRQ
ncbi:UNVERIFIED_CONTAM: hypothetical protein FKN15_006331 [Acipenser sinensis]